MNRFQLEHIVRAASAISADTEIVVIGSQAVHAHTMASPTIAFRSLEADVYPHNLPDRADDIDGAIGELSQFHQTYGYYAHGVSPLTAILPELSTSRLVPLKNANTDGATGLCLDVHDLVLSKYAAGRPKDLEFNLALVRYGCVALDALISLLGTMPIDADATSMILHRIKADFALPRL